MHARLGLLYVNLVAAMPRSCIVWPKEKLLICGSNTAPTNQRTRRIAAEQPNESGPGNAEGGMSSIQTGDAGRASNSAYLTQVIPTTVTWSARTIDDGSVMPNPRWRTVLHVLFTAACNGVPGKMANIFMIESYTR